jgi:hypothetical protein
MSEAPRERSKEDEKRDDQGERQGSRKGKGDAEGLTGHHGSGRGSRQPRSPRGAAEHLGRRMSTPVCFG